MDCEWLHLAHSLELAIGTTTRVFFSGIDIGTVTVSTCIAEGESLILVNALARSQLLMWTVPFCGVLVPSE